MRCNINGLHAAYEIASVEKVEEYEPLEEGLEPVTKTMNYSVLRATITLNKGNDLKSHFGYLHPFNDISIREQNNFRDLIDLHENREKGEK